MWSVDKLESVEYSYEYRNAHIIKPPSSCRIKVNIVEGKITIPRTLSNGVYELHVCAKDRCTTNDLVYVFSVGGVTTKTLNVDNGGKDINYKTCCKQ